MVFIFRYFEPILRRITLFGSSRYIELDDFILEISLSLSYCGFPTKGFVSHKVDHPPTDGLHRNHDQILYKGRHLVKHESKANSSVLSSLNSFNVFLWDTVTASRALLFHQKSSNMMILFLFIWPYIVNYHCMKWLHGLKR